MTTQHYQQARALVEKMDTTHLKTVYDPPVCPRCGAACDRQAREGIWGHCDYSVPISVWNAVQLHAAVLREVLRSDGLTAISFHGHPLPLEEAVLPSFLLPLFIAAAEEFGRIINHNPLLTVQETDEAADEAGTTLLSFYIDLNNAGCQPTESLMLMVAAAREALSTMRETDATGSVMPADFIIDVSQIPVAA